MKWWAWIVPVLLSAAVYVPALDGEFVWDDTIVRDRQMVAFRSVHDVFFPPKGIPEWAKSYYRPAIVGSYLLDQALFGRDSARGAHATVLVYNVIVTLFRVDVHAAGPSAVQVSGMGRTRRRGDLRRPTRSIRRRSAG